ncbi:bZIP transcription factor 44-like [Carex rostrata]
MASPGGSNSSTVRTSSGLKSETNNRNKKREIISPSSSGGYDNSSGISSEPVGSEESSELQALMEQRRKRRKESNRESARRSRMRKQLHLDGMAGQVASLRADNYKMLVMLERATVGILTVEAENSVLRTQAMELESRLRSLNEIMKCIAAADTNLDAVGDTGLVGPWNLSMGMMMPVVQSVDHYQCFQA